MIIHRGLGSVKVIKLNKILAHSLLLTMLTCLTTITFDSNVYATYNTAIRKINLKNYSS